MQHPITQSSQQTNQGGVLRAYLAQTAKEKDHRRTVAVQLWHLLTPAEKRAQQQAARVIAGPNLDLSAAYTESVLLWLQAERQQATARHTGRAAG